MRQRIVASLSVVWLGLVVAPAAASAQRAAGAGVLEQRVEALEQELSALRERAVQVPTLAEAVQELSARLAALERDLGLVERQKQAVPDAIGRIDELDERVRTLAAELEGLRTQLAHLDQPWEPARGAGDTVHDGGFRWTTADGRHALRLSGFVQARYALDLREGEVAGSTFLLRRAWLGLSGHVGSERLSYRLQASALDAPALVDYYVDYAIHGNVAVRFGQYKVPFTRRFLTSAPGLAFVERPRAIDTARYDRDLQLGIHGAAAGDRLGFYAGVGNGAGANRLDDNLWMAATLRADAVIAGKRFAYAAGDLARTPAPSLMIGAGLVHDMVAMPAEIGDIAVDNDVDGDGRRDDVRVLSASVDAVFRYRGVEAALEAVWRHESTAPILRDGDNAALRAAVGDGQTRAGLAGQVTYVLPWTLLSRDLLIGGRVGYAQLPFLGVGGRSSAVPRAEHLLELDGVLQLYQGGVRRLGLMYSLHHYGDQAVPAGDTDHRVLLEAQVVF